MALSQEQQRIQDDFIRVRGTWGDHWEAMLQLDQNSCRPTSTSPPYRGARITSTARLRSSCTSRSMPPPPITTCPASASTSRRR